MNEGRIPEYDPRMEWPVRNADQYREWTDELYGQAAVQALRHELEERRAERLSQQSRLGKLATRVFGPMLADPLEVMFGPKDADNR